MINFDAWKHVSNICLKVEFEENLTFIEKLHIVLNYLNNYDFEVDEAMRNYIIKHCKN